MQTFLGKLFVATLLSSLCFAETQNEKPLTREQVEKLESYDKALDVVRDARRQIEKTSKEFFSDCLKAIGHTKFCNCIKEKRPAVFSFNEYISITISSKDELKYSQQPKDIKQAIDETLKARDQCVEAK